MSKDITVRTLDDMNMFFESRGIKVKRAYDGFEKKYTFHLTRDKFTAGMTFYYPTTEDREERYRQMTNACKSMLDNFNRLHKMDEYCRRDVEVTKEVYFPRDPKAIKKVIFNDPATIVFWSDGSKTVVKCSFNDIYDPEKGLAMAFSKKMFGNDNTFHKHFKEWLPKEEPKVTTICVSSDVTTRAEKFKKFGEIISAAFQEALRTPNGYKEDKK